MSHDYSGHWTWRWIVDPPAHFGDNPIFDVLRLIEVVLALLLTFATARVLREQTRRAERFPPGKTARYLALGLLLWFVAFTEMAVFGTPASPRLFVGLAGVLIGLYGIHQERVEQRRTPVVRR